jgi:outer membrane protein OmpA-like peptidoglycan-associated protein
MTYLVSHYGLWSAIAFLIGALTGFLCRANDPEDATPPLRRGDFLLLLFASLGVAIGSVTLGRVALYFDGVVLLLAAFAAGVGAAIAWSGPISRDRIEWRIGAGALALACVAANMDAASSLEADLRHGLGSLVARAGGDPLSLEVSGRDVYLPADAPGRAAVVERMREAGGVRAVWAIDALSPQAAGRRDQTRAEIAARAAAGREALAAWERSSAAARLAQETLPQIEQRSAASPRDSRKEKSASRIAERRPPAPAPAALGPLVWNAPHDPTLPSAAPVEAETPQPAAAPRDEPPCRFALAALAASEKIRFSVKSAALGSGATKFLTRLARSLTQCPGAVLEIRGHADSLGSVEDKLALSQRRAQAVADYLARAGVARDRVTSAGLADEQPLIPGDDAQIRAENRRVEVGVR